MWVDRNMCEIVHSFELIFIRYLFKISYLMKSKQHQSDVLKPFESWKFYLHNLDSFIHTFTYTNPFSDWHQVILCIPHETIQPSGYADGWQHCDRPYTFHMHCSINSMNHHHIFLNNWIPYIIINTVLNWRLKKNMQRIIFWHILLHSLALRILDT